MDIERKLLSYLPPDPKPRVSLPDRWTAAIGYALVACGVLGTLAFIYVDSRATAKVPIEVAEWHALFPSAAVDCAIETPVASDCLASLANPELWKSDIMRGSEEYKQKLASNGREFWIGTTISPARLHQAARERAQTLVFRHLFGKAELFLDGVFYAQNDYIQQDLPLQIALTPVRAWENRELKIAIRIRAEPGVAIADRPSLSRFEGFFTAVDADKAMRWTIFYGISRHILFIGLFLFSARVLRAASVANRAAYDYVVATQFSLLLCMISIISMDYSTRILSMDAYYKILFGFLYLECIFVLRLTLAFLRAQREFKLTHATFNMVIWLGITAFIPSQWVEASGIGLMTTYLLPMTYVAGGLAVAYRAFSLFANRGAATSARLEFLVVASMTMAATGVVYFIESMNNPGLELHWARGINLLTIYLLIRLLASDYHMAIRIVETAPVSRYHKMKRLPDRIDGWVLMLDLRKSEAWFRGAADFNNAGAVVNAVLSHLWSVIHGAGGQVLQSEGDSLLALFEKEPSGAETRKLLSALAGLETSLRDLNTRLNDSLPEGTFLPPLSFRAAAVRGAVRPVWKIAGEARMPGWVESGSDNAFVNSARLMEMDRELDNSEGASLVVLRAEEATELAVEPSVPSAAWFVRGVDKADKSGRSWTISVLSATILASEVDGQSSRRRSA